MVLSTSSLLEKACHSKEEEQAYQISALQSLPTHLTLDQFFCTKSVVNKKITWSTKELHCICFNASILTPVPNGILQYISIQMLTIQS